MIVTARLTFSAAHRLNNPKYDAEWNRRTYDKCDNAAGHGHNYALEITVQRARALDPRQAVRQISEYDCLAGFLALIHSCRV